MLFAKSTCLIVSHGKHSCCATSILQLMWEYVSICVFLSYAFIRWTDGRTDGCTVIPTHDQTEPGTCKDKCYRGPLCLPSCFPPPSAICQSVLDDPHSKKRCTVAGPFSVSDVPRPQQQQINAFIDSLRVVLVHFKRAARSASAGQGLFPTDLSLSKHSDNTFCCLQVIKLLSVCFLFLRLPSGPLPRSAEQRVPEPKGLRGPNTRAAHRPGRAPPWTRTFRARRPQSRHIKKED